MEPIVEIEQLTPTLRTWDLAASVAFYRDVLGFQCKAHDPALGWACMACGPAELMLSGPNAHEGDRAPGFTGSLYFRVKDVDGLWARLQAHARVCYGIETFDYGMREFAIYDNNGYLLQFGAPAVTG